MENKFSTKNLLTSLQHNPFILNSPMPMGYAPGLPLICILNGNLCMKVPFLKYKVTGEIDKTFVFPPKYLATVTVPEGQPVCFDDISFLPQFGKVDFNSPVGTFRHDAIKDLNKEAYKNLRSELFEEYDKIVSHLINGTPYTAQDEMRFKSLFNTLIEPSLVPFYQAIDLNFANKYILPLK